MSLWQMVTMAGGDGVGMNPTNPSAWKPL